MNAPVQISHIMNDKQWYYLSLFYAREKWAGLIIEIMQFYKKRQNNFCTCLISLSEERGEHLQLIFASFDIDCDYTDDIENYFQNFFNQNPSISRKLFPYGKAVWGNYPNNSLIWNKFKLHNQSQSYIRFHQRTIDIVLKLLADDFSANAILSLCIYLFSKGLFCIDNKEQKDALLRMLHEVSAYFENYSFINTVKELMNEININEVNEVISSYWDENESEYSAELIDWLTEANILLKSSSYSHFCSSVCRILGLNGLHQVMILELINTCITSDKKRIENE